MEAQIEMQEREHPEQEQMNNKINITIVPRDFQNEYMVKQD